MIPTSSGKLGFAVTEEFDRDTFWDKFSHQGLRVAVLDVPKCRPPRPLNGIHLADWLVHGRYFHSRPLAYPEALADDILARFGPAPPSPCAFKLPTLSDDDVLAVRNNLLVGRAEARRRFTLSFGRALGPVHCRLQGSALQ